VRLKTEPLFFWRSANRFIGGFIGGEDWEMS
jgi:hypothetical protein